MNTSAAKNKLVLNRQMMHFWLWIMTGSIVLFCFSGFGVATLNNFFTFPIEWFGGSQFYLIKLGQKNHEIDVTTLFPLIFFLYLSVLAVLNSIKCSENLLFFIRAMMCVNFTLIILVIGTGYVEFSFTNFFLTLFGNIILLGGALYLAIPKLDRTKNKIHLNAAIFFFCLALSTVNVPWLAQAITDKITTQNQTTHLDIK